MFIPISIPITQGKPSEREINNFSSQTRFSVPFMWKYFRNVFSIDFKFAFSSCRLPPNVNFGLMESQPLIRLAQKRGYVTDS